MDKDTLDDDSKLFSSILARRRDIEVVLQAAPSEAEEEECQYYLRLYWTGDF